MEQRKRKRRLIEIGRTSRVKVQKQDLDAHTNFVNNGENCDETSLYDTDYKYQHSNFKKSEVFTKAIIQVHNNRKLNEESLNVIDSRDISGVLEGHQDQKDSTNGKARAYVRDDSGYHSDECADYSGSDIDNSLKSTQSDIFHEGYEPNARVQEVNESRLRANNNVIKISAKNSCWKETVTLAVDRPEPDAAAADYDDDCSDNGERNVCYDDDDDGDDESDVIIPCDRSHSISKSQPKLVDTRWARNSLDSPVEQSLFKNGKLPRSNSLPERILHRQNPRPDQNSTIYIPHEYADEPQGDKFGVDVWTYNIKQKDGSMYYQHYFVDVDFDGPADKMKIRENDEIVLVNGIFVPQITHNDLLNLFHEVKVDGKTRLRLVIRRVKKCTRGSKKEWEWIDTSAVLAPGVHEETDNYPKVERAEYHSHTGDAIEFPPCIMEYNVPGTQYFVDVKNEQVTVSVKKGTAADKTKRICKRSLYKCGSDGNVHYFGALSNEQKDRYISIGTEHEIKLNVSPMWFEFKKDGSGIWFRTNDLFLSCNRSTRKLKADKVKFLFAESSLENGVDCPDGCSSAVESLQPVRMVTRSTVPATHGNRPVSIVAAVNDASYGCFGPGASVDRNTYAAGHDSHKRAENSDRAVTLHIPRNGHISTTPSPCDSLKTPTTPMAALFLAN